MSEGDILLNTVTSLNITMHQLLASLSGSIKSGTEMTDQNLAASGVLIERALGAVVATEEALTQSHSGLTSGKPQWVFIQYLVVHKFIPPTAHLLPLPL